jgi:predicted deacylase
MEKKEITIRDLTVKPGEKAHHWVTIGQMLDGSPYRIPLIVINGTKPGPKLLVGACVHGDEVIGTEAIKTIAKDLTPEDIAGVFIGMPIINIAAYLSLARVDTMETPIGENNMTAMWDTAILEGSMTQRAAAFFRDEVIPLVEYYIDIHSSASGSLNSPRAIIAGAYAELDPVVRKRIDEIGVACNYEVIFQPQGTSWKGMYFPPRTFFEERGIAKIVLETGGAPTLEDVDTIREGITNIMKQTNMIPGDPTKKSSQLYCGKIVAIRANTGGIFRSTVNLRDRVKTGEKLGEVTDVFDNVIEEITSPEGGVVVKIATAAPVYTGIRLIVIAVPSS